jgi:hypothetical protein
MTLLAGLHVLLVSASAIVFFVRHCSVSFPAEWQRRSLTLRVNRPQSDKFLKNKGKTHLIFEARD